LFYIERDLVEIPDVLVEMKKCARVEVLGFDGSGLLEVLYKFDPPFYMHPINRSGIGVDATLGTQKYVEE